MNIVDHEWAAHPPQMRRITLAGLVRDFKWRRVCAWSKLHHNRDDIVDYCGEAEHVHQAIARACRSKRPNGKHHNHQSKVPAAILSELERMLIGNSYRIRHAMSFEDLYDLIDKGKPKGIGPVTTYDVAVRIGAYLELTPRYVYLHAGAQEGYRELVKTGHASDKWLTRIIRLQDLPVELHVLSPDEVEDFLCVYRTVFAQIGRSL